MPARSGHNIVLPGRKHCGDGGGFAEAVMPARISEGRLLGFDPLEWLMLVVAVVLLGLVALAI
jgi:hypothetical protein